MWTPDVRVKRIYEPPDAADGFRVLVDRIWPRGVTREAAAIHLWAKDLGPSHELRQWFGHRPEHWDQFVEQYLRELSSMEVQISIAKLKTMCADDQCLTLLYSARNTQRNQAVVLQSIIRQDS